MISCKQKGSNNKPKKRGEEIKKKKEKKIMFKHCCLFDNIGPKSLG